MKKHPHGAGRSSFDLVDSPQLMNLLKLKNGLRLIDLGCGQGNYSLAMAPLIAPDGRIIAVDLWEEGIRLLSAEIEARNIDNIQPKIADAAEALPIENDWTDICFCATVFHDIVHDGGHEKALEEIKRVLKPAGVFTLVEYRKVNGPSGPPIEIRLSPEELDEMLAPYGFKRSGLELLGDQFYFAEYSLAKK